jgi:hypothetical protein
MSDNSSSILRRLHEIISVIGLDSCEELLLLLSLGKCRTEQQMNYFYLVHTFSNGMQVKSLPDGTYNLYKP